MKKTRVIPTEAPTASKRAHKILETTTQIGWLITIFPRGAENSTRGGVRSPRSVRCALSTKFILSEVEGLGMTRAFSNCPTNYTRNFGVCDRNVCGFLKRILSMISSLCPRRRSSSAVFGTASGSLTPQSHALLSHSRSWP